MIYKYELKKLINMTKVHFIFVFLLVLCCVFQGILINNQIKYLGSSEEYYKEYMEKLEGPVTEEKEQFIQHEKQKIDNALEKNEDMESAYMENKISEEEYLNFNEEYLYAQARQESFARVEQVHENIKENGGWYVYDTYWKSYFSCELYNSIVLLIVIVVFSMYVGNEYLSGMWQYLASSKYGKEKTLITKSIISISSGFLLSLVFCILRFFTFQFVGELPLKSAPMCSLEGFYHLGNVHKISTFCLETIILQSIVIAAMGLISMLVAYFLKNSMTAMIIGVAVYFIPFLLKGYSAGVYVYSVAGMVNIPEAVRVLGKNNMSLMLIPVSIFIMLLLYIYGMKKYQTRR